MMEQATSLAGVLMRLQWEILEAAQDTGFILCDCPVVVVPPKGCDQVGFAVPGSAKYIPLSRQLCVRLGEPGRKRSFRKLDKEAVRIVNQNVAANSERFIMSPSRIQLESIVSRSGCATMESTPRLPVAGNEVRRGRTLELTPRDCGITFPADGLRLPSILYRHKREPATR
jgi:Protein of unknown function (DUF4238)